MRNDEFTRERDDRTPNNGRNGRSAGSARDWQQDRDDNREPRALRDRSDDHSYGQDGDQSRREHPVGYRLVGSLTALALAMLLWSAWGALRDVLRRRYEATA